LAGAWRRGFLDLNEFETLNGIAEGGEVNGTHRSFLLAFAGRPIFMVATIMIYFNGVRIVLGRCICSLYKEHMHLYQPKEPVSNPDRQAKPAARRSGEFPVTYREPSDVNRPAKRRINGTGDPALSDVAIDNDSNKTGAKLTLLKAGRVLRNAI
jgi:hypothetical protein